MHYSLLSGPEGLRSAQAVWQMLEERTPVHVFQTHTFGRLWHETIGVRSNAHPLIVVLEEDGDARGIFPAAVVPYGPIKLLTWLGAPIILDYGDILWDRSASIPAEEFVTHALKLLRERAKTAFLYLTNVRHDAAAYAALSSGTAPYKRTTAPYVETPADFDQYLASLGSGKSAKTLRRHLRRIQEAGTVSFEMVDKHSPDIDDAFAWLVRMKKVRYKGQRGKSDFYLPGHEEFRRALLHEQPGVRISRLTLDGTTIAEDLDCLHAGRLYGMVTAFDPEASSLSPGTVLTAHIIKHCCESGIGVVDLGCGNEKYKYLWTDKDVEATTFVGHNLRGKLIKGIAGTRRVVTERWRSGAGKSVSASSDKSKCSTTR